MTPWGYTMQEALLLGIGAIVGLLASRISLASSTSREQHSVEVLDLAIKMLTHEERERMRDESLRRVAEVLEKLDVSVGNMLPIIRSRTILDRPLQVGEVPDGRPPGPVVRPPWEREAPPLPPQGFESDTKDRNAGEKVRAHAFGEPT